MLDLEFSPVCLKTAQARLKLWMLSVDIHLKRKLQNEWLISSVNMAMTLILPTNTPQQPSQEFSNTVFIWASSNAAQADLSGAPEYS